MLDFTPVRQKRVTLSHLAENLTVNELKDLTNEMVDTQLRLIADCVDGDVIFVPEDTSAYDPFAENPQDITLAWTLGHVIVHVTASSEEAAAIAAELARGVVYHGRSRFEASWQNVTTIEQCRQRLEESQRMRLASLEMWPDSPNLENTYQSRPEAPSMNAISRFLYGLMHDDDHLKHIAKIKAQAIMARPPTSP
jgi:hypothetical protein